ncbi:rRNA pseudouridine synthase [Aquimarina sp. MMG015]|uniref:pseudouridine synthase n=1 Tax=unclassified Aquimarina TaxID=2627091 RepID=UPI000D54D162|nr:MULTISPECIES: pseudouridine synthase [unclassified Aquimarina]AXT56889.1 rRNA pseudouridine synthase [Aquimarina sp. AD1]MBQ4802898.1 rRNA pseudouridine synthase [Aquimarina sp. MMG015]RKN18408.1 rRNA pseudouridine synthase [Aquimarina sp. AD1]
MSRGDNSNRGKGSGRQGGKPNRKSYSKGKAPIKGNNNSPKKISDPDQIRLNKFVANSGVCSRRDADLYIQTGSVWVNGKPVTEMGYKVKLTDEVKFDGRLITPERKEYVLLNKPKGFVTSTSPEKTRTVMDLVANASKARLKPVGRLERNTTGLLLFTNDVDLEKKLTHHKTGVRKIFHVELDRNLKFEDFQKIEKGVRLEEGFISVDEISYIEGAAKNEIGIQLMSSKNGIVTKLFEHLNYGVVKLDRVIFAGLTKKDLPRGHWRILTEQEVINMKMM